MSTSPKRDPLPPFCREVLQLYTEVLADVRFPDLDLRSLQASAEQVRIAELAVERVEAKLDAARAQLQEQIDAMSTSAARALAYAQVFAQTDPALQARVEQVGGTAQRTPVTEPRTKRRGRRSKGDPQDENLFTPQSESNPDHEPAESAA